MHVQLKDWLSEATFRKTVLRQTGETACCRIHRLPYSFFKGPGHWYWICEKRHSLHPSPRRIWLWRQYLPESWTLQNFRGCRDGWLKRRRRRSVTSRTGRRLQPVLGNCPLRWGYDTQGSIIYLVTPLMTGTLKIRLYTSGTWGRIDENRSRSWG